MVDIRVTAFLLIYQIYINFQDYSRRYNLFQFDMGSQQTQSIIIDQKTIYQQSIVPVAKQNLNSLSHRSIGAISFLNFSQQKGAGSGVLISKNLVLTVAHNIYDINMPIIQEDGTQRNLLKNQNPKSSYMFYVGGVLGERYYQVADWRYPTEYRSIMKNKESIKYDYGLIKLKTCVEDAEQFMELSFPCNICSNFKEQFLEVYGYPIHQDNYKSLDQFGTKISLTQYGLTRKDRIVSFEPANFNIKYAVSTKPGHSGCPIIMNNKIIAIHKGASNSKEDQVKQEYNFGRLITPDLIDNLNQWTKELQAEPFKIAKGVCFHQLHYHYDFIPSDVKQILEKTKMNEELRLDNKGLEAVNVTRHINLKNLSLFSNRLTAIDLRSNKILKKIELGSNLFKEIDFSPNHHLIVVIMNDNLLQSIDLTSNINLLHLNLHCNRLRTIDLTVNKQLTELSLSSNLLSAIDLSNNANLNQLELQHNNLTAISMNYTLKLQDFLFSHQQSKVCKLILVHKKIESQSCREIGELQIQIYNNDKQQNGYNCEYRLIMMEKG